MRAQIPREYNSLPPAQRERILAYLKTITEDQCEKDARIMLDLYIKMVCVTLHDAFGFGEKRLYMFLGNHKQLFRRQVDMVKRDEQLKYLDRRMKEIFCKDGFPQKFFDDMIGEISK